MEGIMWSKTKKRLEEMICDKLQNRVKFHCSSYRMHDSIGRCYITIDKNEVLNMCDLKSNVYNSDFHNTDTDFSQVKFFDVVNEYFDNSIQKSMESSEVITKILIILDKRVGKRTLIKMEDSIRNDEEIMQLFYKLRCEAEGISIAF